MISEIRQTVKDSSRQIFNTVAGASDVLSDPHASYSEVLEMRYQIMEHAMSWLCAEDAELLAKFKKEVALLTDASSFYR
mgnify:CR=1 FL=1